MSAIFGIGDNYQQPSITGNPGSLVRVRWYNPDGSIATELALTEGPAFTFTGAITLSSAVESTTLPYEYEARQVTAQNSAAFDASTNEVFSRGFYGYLYNGNWNADPTSPIVGMWGTLAMVQGMYSPDNLNAWGVNPTPNVSVSSMIQAAFNRADSDILMEFQKQYSVPPGPSSAYAVGTVNYNNAVKLAWIECELVGVYLYEANGLQDATRGIDGKMTNHRTHAMQELGEMFFRNNAQFARTTGYSDAPFGVAATVDPSGYPVSNCPLWPTYRWNGNYWQWGNAGGN